MATIQTPRSRIFLIPFSQLENRASQRTVRRTLTDQCRYGLATGTLGGTACGAVAGCIAFAISKRPEAFIPTLTTYVIAAGAGGLITRVTLTFLKSRDPNITLRRNLGIIGGALFGISLGLSVYISDYGLPFTTGAPVTHLFIYTCLASVVLASICKRGSINSDPFTSICLGAGIASLLGLVIGSTNFGRIGAVMGTLAGITIPLIFLISYSLAPFDVNDIP
jgi:hypothetical protein